MNIVKDIVIPEVTAAYLTQLKETVGSLLTAAFSDTTLVERLVSEEYLPVWVKAFTYQGGDYDNNYELLEYMGDRVLHLIFAQYLIQRFPNQEPSVYTELNNNYMSRIHQGKLAEKLEFDKLIRPQGLPFNISADVFESFIGALSQVGDAVIGAGSGWNLSYNFISYLYQDPDSIDINKGAGAPKTQVEQIFRRFNKGVPFKKVINENGRSTVKIYLLAQQIVFLQELGIKIPTKNIIPNVTQTRERSEEHNFARYLSIVDQSINMTPALRSFMVDVFQRTFAPMIENMGEGLLIATASGQTTHTAENTAYSDALRLLETLGVTQEVIKNYRRQFDFQAPVIKAIMPRVEAKYRREGFIDIFFVIPRKLKNNNQSVLQLIGTYPDSHSGEKHRILITLTDSTPEQDPIAERLAALNAYLETTYQ